MNDLPDLVRDSLADLTGAATMPPGVGERAMAMGRRRRRQRATLVGAAAVVSAAVLVVPFMVLRGGGGAAPAAGASANVLFALRHTEYLAPAPGESDVHRWEVLDPETGRYRDVAVKAVSEPSNDLSVAAVLPKGDGEDVPRQIGRYSTTTGELRWYDVPIQPDSVSISPDGRYAAARGWDQRVQTPDMVVVDLKTGQVRRFNTASLYETAEPPDKGEQSTPLMVDLMAYESMPEISWAPDSRHLLFGAAVTDLDGRRLADLVWPPGTGLVGVHRGGAGTLVRTGLAVTDYALVTENGVIPTGRARVTQTCEAMPQGPERCRRPWAQFLSWRGRDKILIQTAPGGHVSRDGSPPPVEAPRYEVLDLRTGESEAISVPRFEGDGPPGDIAHSFTVVISADGLSAEVRDRVAF